MLVFAAAYGGLVYAIAPGWPIAMNDDFAYLRSIVETEPDARPAIHHAKYFADAPVTTVESI